MYSKEEKWEALIPKYNTPVKKLRSILRETMHQLNVSMAREDALHKDFDEVSKQRDELQKRLDFFICRFQHTHVDNGKDDLCKECGLDIRSAIHIKIAADEEPPHEDNSDVQ